MVAGIALLGSIAGGGFSYRAAASANRIQERRVTLEEYERTQAFYRELLAEMERHLNRLRTQTKRLHAQLQAVETQLAQEQDISNVLRSQVRSLQGQVSLLEQTMTALRLELERMRQQQDPSVRAATTQGGATL